MQPGHAHEPNTCLSQYAENEIVISERSSSWVLFQLISTAAESALDPALPLLWWGRRASGAESIVGWAAVKLDWLTRIVWCEVFDGNSVLTIHAIIHIVRRECLVDSSRVTELELIRVRVVRAEILWLPKLVQLVERAILRAGIG